jgi:hypothetical protein
MQVREAESEAQETPGDACYSREADSGGAKRQCKSAVVPIDDRQWDWCGP